MALRKRDNLDEALDDICNGKQSPVYLCFGERYLCQQAANHIEQAFLKTGHGTIHTIDGTTEDASTTVSRLQSFSLLPGWQLYRVSDSRLFLSRNVGADLWDRAVKARQDNKPDTAARHLIHLLALAYPAGSGPGSFSALSVEQWRDAFGFDHPGDPPSWADEIIVGKEPVHSISGDAAEKLIAAIEKGFPPRTVLLLLSEHVDKRKRLFSCIKNHGEIIDCAVAEGASRAAQEAQKQIVREMALSTIREFGKTIDPQVLEHAFDRIGFHPVAVVREMEKLALYTDERRQITRDDLDQIVGRTREDALFELTEALADHAPAKALVVLHHLLHDGIHDLAIVASLRNFLRRLLIFRSLQLQSFPQWHPTMTAAEFQARYLPSLKETGVWPDLLKGHPYALFMSFKKAADWRVSTLKSCLSRLLEAEYRLKTTPLPPRLVLEELVITLVALGSKTPPAAAH